MNVLFLNDIPFNPLYGGIERVTDSLVRVLINRGYKIFYLCGKVHDYEMLEFKFPAPIFTLPNDGLFSSKENMDYYISFIEKYNIDVVINQRGLECDFNASLISKPGVKFISVVNSMPLAYMYSAIYSNKLPVNGVKNRVIKFVKSVLHPWYKIQKRKIHAKWSNVHYNFLLNSSDKVVLLSENYKDELLSVGIDVIKYNDRIKAIPNPNSFINCNLNYENKKNIILFVGRLNYEKNPMALLKCWSKIEKQLPDWELQFVGDGDVSSEMCNYIKSKRLCRVVMSGRKNNVRDFYNNAKIICLTSYYEGWGMSLTEGMQYGCVPVVFDSYAAASDIVDNGVNGFLVTPFKINELAKCILKLACDDVLMKRMSQAAFNKTKRYDISIVADEWEKIIN